MLKLPSKLDIDSPITVFINRLKRLSQDGRQTSNDSIAGNGSFKGLSMGKILVKMDRFFRVPTMKAPFGP